VGTWASIVYNHAAINVADGVATVNFGPPGQGFKKGVARFLEKRACFTGG